jgi:hypothetical protein
MPENTAFRLLHCKRSIVSGGLDTINWQQAMAHAREQIWNPGGVKGQRVSLQCIDLRGLLETTSTLFTLDAILR